MKPLAVIFDIGNVLIEWVPERYFDRVIGKDRRKAMFAEVDLHAMNDRIDRGEDFKSVVYETAAACPEWQDEIRMWHDNWIELATPEISLSVQVLRDLRRASVQVFALTNFGVAPFAVAEPVYPFLKEFDRRYISGQMSMAKPDANIYAAVETDCGIAPDRLLFTDDRIDNITAAQSRGWQTHLFTDPEGWQECLKSHGLLT